MEYSIGYDKEASTEMDPFYFVFSPSENNAIIFSGSYLQCIVVIGAMGLYPALTLEEINAKCNGVLDGTIHGEIR